MRKRVLLWGFLAASLSTSPAWAQAEKQIITSPGAIVAVHSGNFYDAKTDQPAFSFSAGDTFCVDDLHDNNSGRPSVWMVNPNAPEYDIEHPAVVYAYNNGTFAPDPQDKSGCAVTAQSRDADATEHSIIKTLELIAGLSALGGLWAAYMRLTRNSRRRAREERDRQAARLQAVEARWPRSRFPRMVQLGIKRTPEDELNDFERVLAAWPKAPSNEIERQEQEDKFWKNAVLRYEINEHGDIHLKPKQNIIDDFMENEIWFLREYYAATGNYIEAHRGPEWVRLRDKVNAAKAWYDELGNPRSDHPRYGQKQTALADLKAAREKFEEYTNNGLKEHIEKWGGWYFMQVELAFKGVAPDNFGPGSATSAPDHPAGDDIEYNPTA